MTIKNEIPLPGGGTCQLSSFSDSDLEGELQARKERLKAEQAERDRRRCQIVVENIDVFLALSPNHDRTSCSDADPCNASRVRCTRCVLLAAKREGYLDHHGIMVSFHLEGLI